MVRRALHTRRVGHAGTLDPFASGLLLLCVGSATRLTEYATALDKSYDATLQLGAATDTHDRTGVTTASTTAWRDIDRDRFEAALARQRGEILQVPPAYSAKQVDGERSYRLARRGQAVTLAPVRVRIAHIALTRWAPPEADVTLTCSSGTYVRAIARDVGEDLGCHAHLTRLRRTAIGPYRVERAVPLDRLDAATAGAAMLPPAAAIAHLPRVTLPAAAARRVMHGQRLAMAPESATAAAIAIFLNDELIAVGEIDNGVLRPRKVLRDD
jgi:tRNA pseudouridine55 synthase